MPRRQALDQQGERGPVLEPVGYRVDHRLRRHRILGIAPARNERDHALPVHGAPGNLTAEHQRHLVAGEVRVLALMGVGEVQAGARHLDQNLAFAGLGLGQVDDLEHLGAAELFDLHRSHAVGNLRTSASLREPMSLVAVGSIAFDAIKTPFGERDRALGGAAVHFALAASYFSDVRVVGPVGDDFGEAEYDVLRRHDVNTDDVEHVEGGKTFFYACEYEWNLNVRHTLDTQLNVFADFQPKLSQASRDAETLFLANIQPDLQREVREQCTGATVSGLDSMNFWIESARESLVRTIAMVDLVLMNDDEVRMLTEEPTLLKGARQLMDLGPSAVVVKQGEYGAALITREGFFSLPAYPLETVIDPTGAGDSFAGGFLGYLDAQGGATDDATLRKAMTYGSAVASFWVEEFGCERAESLTREEIDERYEAFRQMTFIAADA